MKTTILLILSFAIVANFTGCALRVYENGHLLLSDSSDSNGHLHVHTKAGTDIDFQGMRDNSTPTKTALHGAHKLAADVVAGAIGLSVPGGTVETNLIKGATTVAPQVNSTQSNSPSVK